MTHVIPAPTVIERIGPGRPTLAEIRDRLGREQYDRMRRGMLPTLGRLPAWHELSEAARESYRKPVEYLVPAVLELVAWAPPPPVRVPPQNGRAPYVDRAGREHRL